MSASAAVALHPSIFTDSTIGHGFFVVTELLYISIDRMDMYCMCAYIAYMCVSEKSGVTLVG